jgi:hypothetical protein
MWRENKTYEVLFLNSPWGGASGDDRKILKIWLCFLFPTFPCFMMLTVKGTEREGCKCRSGNQLDISMRIKGTRNKIQLNIQILHDFFKTPKNSDTDDGLRLKLKIEDASCMDPISKSYLLVQPFKCYLWHNSLSCFLCTVLHHSSILDARFRWSLPETSLLSVLILGYKD